MASLPTSIQLKSRKTRGGRLRLPPEEIKKAMENLGEFKKTRKQIKGGKISAKKLLRFAINPWFGVAGLIADKVKERKKKTSPPVVAQKRPREDSFDDFTDEELRNLIQLIDAPANDQTTVPLPVKTDGNFNPEPDEDVPPPLPPRDLITTEPSAPPLPPRDLPEVTFAEQLQAQKDKLRKVEPKSEEEKLFDANPELINKILQQEDMGGDEDDGDEWGDVETTQYDPYLEEIMQNTQERKRPSTSLKDILNEHLPITSLRIDEDRIRSRRRAIAPEEMSDDETGWGIILRNLRKKKSRGRKTRRCHN